MSDSTFARSRADAGVAPSIQVVRHSERIALVTLVGEHDISTKPRMQDALARASEQPCVVVDLSLCPFVDSSFIGILLALHGTAACSIRLVVPETGRAVRRTFELVRLGHLFPMHASLELGLIAAHLDDPVDEPRAEAAS
ncbi:MAG: hypothetical protein QOE87_4547 [Gaiellales bacterium]|nr:hypothetical protein [Gaiellales bacterium]